MADFDLIQTDAQVQSILNDGQNMQGAGAQTTLTTESVLLKDVNGNYHKILKSSFTEAIRDTLAGLLVNNDKGTTINQIAAIASGDFGSITPVNLASVLGANSLGTLSSISSLGNGTFTVRNSNTTTDVPSQIKDNNHAFAIVRIGFDTDRHSTIITDLDVGGSWKRVDDNASWVRVDNFGCNTPADLASLLGVPTVIASGDLSNVAGSPTTYYGTIVLYKQGYYPIWFCFGQSPFTIWYGISDADNFNLTDVTWKEVSFTN